LTLKFEKEQDQARILALEKENLEKDLDLKQRTIQRNAFIFTVFAVIALAVFLFLYVRQKRKKDGIIAQQKIHELEEEKKLMAAMSLMEGQEEERKRIAIELHDGLGVLLSATKMQFTSIKDTSPENLPMIERATQLLEQASGDVRKISHNMMPGLLTKLGLYEAIEDLFENINYKENLKAQCIIPEGMKRLPENREIMLYRIIQEMVNNTLKHASAKSIKLQFLELKEKLELQYSDDGKGFEVDKKLEAKSLGLKSIQSRVNFLKGTMIIESRPGQGTSYTIQIPD
jgi:signal transduction histidine kinase